MQNFSRLIAGGLGVLFLLLGATPASGTVRHARSLESDAAVRQWWTPERMARAPDISDLAVPSGAPAAPRGIAPGPAVPPGFANTGGPSSTVPARALRHSAAYDAPDAIGRLFFRTWGQKASCTGSVIDTPSQRLVLTAAHCLKMYGRWSSYIYFVPGYFWGDRPHGSWFGRDAWVTGPWARHSFGGADNFDLGVVITKRTFMGQRIGRVTGALPYNAFPRRWGRTRIFGYPAGSNRGREVRACRDRKTWRGPWWSRRLPGPVGMGARCDMARGSSGGPWLSAYRNGPGGIEWIIDGLTSTGIGGRLGSPYFGSHFRKLIHDAENSTG